MNLASKLFKGDREIWIIFMLLCMISVVEVFSATSTLAYKSTTYWDPIMRHATFLVIGTVVVMFMHNLPYRIYSLATLFVPISVVLLILTFFIGKDINGERRWLEIAGVTFQPSEVAKLALIGYTAFIMSKRNWFTDRQMFWWIQGATLLVCGLIMVTNGSTAILLFGVIQMMAFFGQVSLVRLLKFWSVLIAAGALMIAVLYYAPEGVMKYLPDRAYTWKERIERFFSPETPVTMEEGKAVSIDDEYYQETHAKIAIARGGLLGQFPGHGQQRDFLPQAYSDFIYAIIIEEMGILGGAAVLFLYIFLLVRVGMIARRCDKLFPKFLVLGCGLLLVVQALTNMAVAVGLIPVTGQPLPLISRGGTSTVISCAYIGIILSVSRFGAHIGEEEEKEASEENPTGIEPEADWHPSENGLASVENGSAAVENSSATVENGSGAVEKPLEAAVEWNKDTNENKPI